MAEERTNADRADTGARVVEFYMAQFHGADYKGEEGGPPDYETACVDLCADLQHWMKSKELDIEDVGRMASIHFTEEVFTEEQEEADYEDELE